MPTKVRIVPWALIGAMCWPTAPPPLPKKKSVQEKILAILASWSFHQKPTAKVGLFQFKRYFPFKKDKI